MKIRFLPKLLLLVALISKFNYAQEITPPFDYTTTLWIINTIENSGTVYGRPRPEDYDERQGFIYIYNILIKYVANLHDIDNETGSELVPTHQLVLINGVREQRILLGDHWISDQYHIVSISETDYNNLTAWLGTKETNHDYKENPPLAELLEKFHPQTTNDIQDFNHYFNRDTISSIANSQHNALTKQPEIASKSETHNEKFSAKNTTSNGTLHAENNTTLSVASNAPNNSVTKNDENLRHLQHGENKPTPANTDFNHNIMQRMTALLGIAIAIIAIGVGMKKRR